MPDDSETREFVAGDFHLTETHPSFEPHPSTEPARPHDSGRATDSGPPSDSGLPGDGGLPNDSGLRNGSGRPTEGRPATGPGLSPVEAAPISPAAPQRSTVGDENTVPTNIYRARRPAAAAMLVIPAVLFGLLLARALAMSAFGQQFSINGVIASCLALASLPLLVTGLYGLITGAAYGAEQWGFKVWARPPLAYLLVGLGFLVAAGLALH